MYYSNDAVMVPFKGVNRKNTWKKQYINFKRFVPISYKRTLVCTLYDRVRKICCVDNLEKEMEFLHETFKRNGYATRFIEKCCEQRPKVAVDTAPRMKVYLSLPYKGDNVTTSSSKGDLIWPLDERILQHL